MAPTSERTSNDLDTGGVASVHHVLVLFFTATLRLKLITGDLVVDPPLVTLHILVNGVHLDVTISYVAGSVPVGLAGGK